MLSESGDNSLAISDLHLGLEYEIAEKGVTLRSPLREEMLSELLDLIKVNSINRLIILGDLKHTIGSINKSEWDGIPGFLERLCSETEVYVVPGNHDANVRHLLPSQVNLMATTGMVISDTLLIHGHTTLPQRPSQFFRIVMGHSHPVFFKRSSVLNGQQVWVYLRVEKHSLLVESEEEKVVDVVILPSFNKYLYAVGAERRLRQSSRPRSPVVSKIMANRKSIIRCVITTLDGAIVGDVTSLQYVIDG